MKMRRRTPWFCGNCDRPERPGVYETWDKGLAETYYNYWNGLRWCGGWTSAHDAFEHRDHKIDDNVQLWRGLTAPSISPSSITKENQDG